MIDCTSTLESYKTYPYKDKNSKHYVSKAQYRQTIRKINQKAFELLLTTGKPYTEKPLGKKQIFKIRPVNPIKNKYLSKQLEKNTVYKNFHTDGYVATVFWKKAKFPLSKFWYFGFNRMLKRPNHAKKRKLNMKDYIAEHGLEHILEAP